MTDPIDELLAPKGPSASEEVRRTALAQSLEALRLRRRPPYEAVGLLLAALVTGVLMLAGPLFHPPGAPPREDPIPSPTPAPPPVPTPVPPSTAVEAEWQAVEHDPRMYREAGNLYLREGSPADAVRCYGRALDVTQDIEPRADDGFLLMAIKYARKKEREPCGP
jgi:hypothetical protein